MIVKIPGWLAYKLTTYSKNVRRTDYFTVLKETDKAYQVAFLRESEPLGWIAKSLVLDKQEDDSKEWNRFTKEIKKTAEQYAKDVEKYNIEHKKDVQKREEKLKQWLKDHEERFNVLRKLEDIDSWIAIHIDYNIDKTLCSFGLSNINEFIQYLKDIDLDKYDVNFSTIKMTLKNKKGLHLDL